MRDKRNSNQPVNEQVCFLGWVPNGTKNLQLHRLITICFFYQTLGKLLSRLSVASWQKMEQKQVKKGSRSSENFTAIQEKLSSEFAHL